MERPLIPVEDVDDPRLAVFRHLKATNETRDAGLFVVEGETLFERLVGSEFAVASVLVSDRARTPALDRLPADVPIYLVSHAQLENLVGFNFHRGVLASGVRRESPRWEGVVASAGENAVLVVCPRIDNPENLGSILRIADVFGVAAVMTGPRCPDPLSRRVLRVSMGSALGVPVLAPADLSAALRALRAEHGFRVAATVLDPTAVPLDGVQPGGRIAVLLGSEGHGLDPEWVDLCDLRVTIPMRPGAESLNVAVAAGIILHRLTAGLIAPS